MRSPWRVHSIIFGAFLCLCPACLEHRTSPAQETQAMLQPGRFQLSNLAFPNLEYSILSFNVYIAGAQGTNSKTPSQEPSDRTPDPESAAKGLQRVVE